MTTEQDIAALRVALSETHKKQMVRDAKTRELCDAVNGGPAATSFDEDIATVKAMRSALERIAVIESRTVGGDWDEIDEARNLAVTALTPKGRARAATPPAPTEVR